MKPKSTLKINLTIGHDVENQEVDLLFNESISSLSLSYDQAELLVRNLHTLLIEIKKRTLN